MVDAGLAFLPKKESKYSEEFIWLKDVQDRSSLQISQKNETFQVPTFTKVKAFTFNKTFESKVLLLWDFVWYFQLNWESGKCTYFL